MERHNQAWVGLSLRLWGDAALLVCDMGRGQQPQKEGQWLVPKVAAGSNSYKQPMR